jgi:hypothetical protein
MTDNVSQEAAKRIETMVERVAQKAGYTGRQNMTYKELLQAKLQQKRDKAKNKIGGYRRKLSLKPGNADFAEEIRTYLTDGLVDLMKEGRTEAEAIEITLKKFDEAELNESFDDFAKAFGGFGMKEWSAVRSTKADEAAGLFYAAFVVLGSTLGALVGWLLGGTWQVTLIGLGVGLFTGVGLGLLSNAIIVARMKE